MPIDPKRVQAVFLSAVECHEPAARAAILDRECADDVELRRRVEALLRGYDRPRASSINRSSDPPATASCPSRDPTDNGLEGTGAESPVDASGGSDATVGLMPDADYTKGVRRDLGDDRPRRPRHLRL